MARHKKSWKARLRRLDKPVMIITAALCGIGFMLLYSGADGHMMPWAWPQIIRCGVGIIIALAIAVMPLPALVAVGMPFYIGMVGLLLVVELFGMVGMGAQRWINLGVFVLQPSEPTKLAVILLLARYFHQMNYENIGRIIFVLPALAIVAVPAALVLLQPNLGTAMILAIIAGAMFFAAGLRWWKFAAVGISAAAAAPVVWMFMHDYQKRRVMTFLNPEADPLGAGYNIMQSQIAIGSGGMFGRGFLQGSQARLDFLPEKQTDFVFTMMAEEFGFVGSIFLLLLYGMLLWRGYRIAASSQHHFGRLVAIGVCTYLFAHVFINIAMVMGLLPVVGLPLPFLSYGGTNIITSLMAVALLLNIDLNREERLYRVGG